LNKLLLISLATVLVACASAQNTMPMNGPKTQIVHAKPIMHKTIVKGTTVMNPALIIEHKFQAYMLQGNATALANLYSTNAIVYSPDRPEIHGRPGIMQDFQGLFRMGKVTSFKFHDLHHRMAGNMCFTAGRVAMTVQPIDGSKPMTQDFRFTDVTEKIQGKWQITVDHVSTPMPPMDMNYNAPMKPKKQPIRAKE